MFVSPKHLNRFKIVITQAFGKYLLPTNVIFSGVLMGLGDAAEQLVELNRHKHPTGRFDWKRLTDMTIVGFMIGLPQHFFYNIMDYKLPGNSGKTIFKKIILDQTIASPGAIAIFFYGLGLIENGNFSSGHKEFTTKFTTVYMMDWCFWPPTQFINFYFLSPKYRVLYVNAMTMLYDVFLSYVKFIHNPNGIEKHVEMNNTTTNKSNKDLKDC